MRKMQKMTDELMNPNEETRVAEGSKVDLHFFFLFESGVEIDNTRSREELVRLVMGDGSLLPGFEKALFGLRAGDRRTVSLPPEDAFGPWNAENIQKFDTVKFEQLPVEGHMIEFEDKAKQSLFGVVKTVGEDITDVDFNHPLAGKNITFEVEIFKVTPAGQQGIKFI